MSKKKKIIISAIVILICFAIYHYLISPAFREVNVNDSFPVQFSGDEDVSSDVSVFENKSEIEYTFAHPAEGSVVRIDSEGKTILRYEDFKTIDGPRLNVYLLKDLDANEFYDLGYRKGTSGSINYEIPSDVDLDEYKYIAHWCVPFRTLFNYAEIPRE